MLAAGNIQGLNKHAKHVALRHFIRKHSIKLLGVLETRVKAEFFKRVSASCFKQWGVINNYYFAHNGRV